MVHGFLLSEGTLTTIDYPGGISGTYLRLMELARRVSSSGLYTDHGTIAGGDALRTRAYLRDASGNFTAIDFPSAENTFAIKITPTGQVVGLLPPPEQRFCGFRGRYDARVSCIRTVHTNPSPCLAPCTMESHDTAGLSLACGFPPQLNSTRIRWRRETINFSTYRILYPPMPATLTAPATTVGFFIDLCE